MNTITRNLFQSLLTATVGIVPIRARAPIDQRANVWHRVTPSATVPPAAVRCPARLDAGAAAAAIMPAVRLVAEYVRRDAEGERLTTDPWLDSAIVEPEREPGYDSFTVIESCSARFLRATARAAAVEVRYHVIGRSRAVQLSSGTIGFRIPPADTVETATFKVVLTKIGWRIAGPQIEQHVTPAGLLAHSAAVILPPAQLK